MNLIKLARIYKRASKLINLLEDAKMEKSLWKSKTFWFNILATTTSLLEVIPLPQEYVIPAIGIINVLLRTVTDKPVKILPHK